MSSKTASIAIALLVLVAAPTIASWVPGGNLLAEGAIDDLNLRVMADGEGGAIVLWSERNGTDADLRAQRFSAGGQPQWTVGGVEIRPFLSYVSYPALCSDGAGGAWVVWAELRGTHHGPFMQHVDAGGELDPTKPAGWPLLDVSTRAIENLHCVPDGTGGAVVSWNEYWVENVGPGVVIHHVDVRTQRVHSAGVIAWGGEGRIVYASEHPRSTVPLVPVSDGGCIVGWRGYGETRLQRLDGIGDTPWGASGVALQGPAYDLYGAGSDAWDGVMVLYRGASKVPYVERLLVGGTAAWSAPLPLWTDGIGPSTVYEVDLVSHPSGRLFCTWISDESGSRRIHGALVDPLRSLTWGTGWLLVSNELGPVHEPRALLSGDDHVVLWRESGSPGDAILGQSISLAGQRQWGQQDRLLFTRAQPIQQLEGAGSTLGPTIFAWLEGSSTSYQWIYVSAVDDAGTLPQTNLTVEMSIADTQPSLGEELQPRIVVHNEGDAALQNVKVNWYADLDHSPTPTDSPTGSPLAIASLAAGDSVVWQPTVAGATQEAVWLSWAVVDPYDEIAEPGAEGDNVAGPVAVQWTARPDLRISSLQASDMRPRVGDPLTFTVVVVNEGSADSGPFDVDLYRDRATSPPLGLAGTQTHRVSFLGPGETDTWVVEGFVSSELDSWTTWAQVDTQNEREEADESDNVAGPHSVLWQPPHLAGWPVAVSAPCTAPALTHLDRTLTLTRNVVVACVDGTVHAWDDGGQSLPGWPLAVAGPVTASVAVGDVTGDSGLEVVIGNAAGQLFCVGADATPYWVFSTPDGSAIPATVALADLVGDAKLEVVFGTEGGSLYVLDGTGTPLPGWPANLKAPLYAPPAVGQMGGGGDLEIVAVASSPGSGWSDVYVLTPAAHPYSGAWPTRLSGEVRAAPAVGDIGGNSDREIALGTDTGLLWVLTLGGPVPGFPISYGAGFDRAFALANLSGDAHLEIVAPTERQVSTFPPHWESHFVTFDATGSVLSGWPLIYPGPSSVRPADGAVVWAWPETLDMTLALGLSTGQCLAVDASAKTNPLLELDAASSISASLAVGDLDLDRQLDVVVASASMVDVYSLLKKSYRADLLAWPTFRHDNRRTGVYGTDVPTSSPPDVSLHEAVWLGSPRPNPGNPSVALPYSLAEPDYVEIAVFDCAGRRVSTLVDAFTASLNGIVRWDGRDAQGRSVASGTYFVRLRTGDGSVRSQKVALVE